MISENEKREARETYPGAFGRDLTGGIGRARNDMPGAIVDVQSGSLKACHSRTLDRLSLLQQNTEMLQGILYKLDGARPPQTGPSNNLKSGNAEKEPDHPTFTARKIEGLLETEIDMQRAIMDQIHRSIG